MSDYKLYYWSVPFRGQFVRAVLAFSGKTWTEGGDDAISKLMEEPAKKMPVPFMGLPLLVDKKGRSIACLLGSTIDAKPYRQTRPGPNRFATIQG